MRLFAKCCWTLPILWLQVSVHDFRSNDIPSPRRKYVCPFETVARTTHVRVPPQPLTFAAACPTRTEMKAINDEDLFHPPHHSRPRHEVSPSSQACRFAQAWHAAIWGAWRCCSVSQRTTTLQHNAFGNLAQLTTVVPDFLLQQMLNVSLEPPSRFMLSTCQSTGCHRSGSNDPATQSTNPHNSTEPRTRREPELMPNIPVYP